MSSNFSWRSSSIVRSLRLLKRSDQIKIFAVTGLQMFSALLDLLGVAIIGVLGALTVIGFGAGQPGNRISKALSILHLNDKPLQTQALILGISAALILVFRTLFSIFFTRKTLFFLSNRGAVISDNLVSRLLNQNLLKIQERNTQETLYAVTQGVNMITMGVLATTVTMVADSALLIIMSAGLFYIDPAIAIGTFMVFTVIGVSIYKLTTTRAWRLGAKNSNLSIKSSQQVIEVLESYRENTVRGRKYYYAKEIAGTRSEIANTLAEMQFMPYISKYIIEATVVLGGLAICGFQFLLQDAQHAVAVLAVFLAAGTRIAPAVLRIQQGALQVRGNLGAAKPTLDLIDELVGYEPIKESNNVILTKHINFAPSIAFDKVSFRYPTKSNLALSNVTFDIPAGSVVAIVGKSGAGKTTLADVLLGVIEPQTGTVRIADISPVDAIARWPGAIAYVPQNVVIVEGTLRRNVALGYPEDRSVDDLIWKALEIAQIEDFVSQMPDGLDTHIGERGGNLSGGQRQRIGIARAMITKPRLLVLDEATSSLDGQTEAYISDAIQTLKGDVTVVTIAHRLSTVRTADTVIYLDNGAIAAIGTFNEVRESVPNFDKQARLMGL